MKMAENTQRPDGMDAEIHVNRNNRELSENRENVVSKISIFDHINGNGYENTQTECFIVDMEHVSQLMEKDISAINNSGITLHRNLSRKSSQRGGEKLSNASAGNQRDANFVFTAPQSPLSQGVGTTEKSMMVKIGTTLTEIPTQNSKISGNGTLTTDNKFGGRRFSFKGSSSSWGFHPRKILFFSATLSCIGTMLLICLTIAMAKTTLDDNVALE